MLIHTRLVIPHRRSNHDIYYLQIDVESFRIGFSTLFDVVLLFTLAMLDLFYNIFVSSSECLCLFLLTPRPRQRLPMRVAWSLAEQGVVGSHTQKTKVAVLDVLTQPSLLLLIVNSVDSKRKLANENVSQQVCHDVLRVVKS